MITKTTADVLKGMIDELTGDISPSPSNHDLVEINVSQANVIMKKNAEIERLKQELTQNNDYIEKTEIDHSEMSDKVQEQEKEIEELKVEVKQALSLGCIELGDLKLGLGNGDLIIKCSGKEAKFLNPADVSKKLRELYFRTEEKRSCSNCGDNCNPLAFHDGCQRNGYDKWQPKTS